jgi:eukaryotic-like serine/threonine-protein kinase
LLGTGGFAMVWLAYDDRLDDHVAIKVLAENWSERLDIRARFEHEAKLLRRTKSSRVVEVHDIDELPDGRPYFVMTYADRGNLADQLENGQLAVGQALHYGAEIARGVSDLHRAGVVHRDIKPSNVLFRSANTAGHTDLLLADLGLSREIARGSRLTLAAGTPGYMAPEQNDPDRVIDERVDIYSVGATVYHVLTGRPPTVPIAAPSTLRPGLPADTDAILLRALDRDPDRRWNTAEALATALEGLTTTVTGTTAATVLSRSAAPVTPPPAGLATTASPAVVPPAAATTQLPTPRSRRRGLLLATLTVVVLAGAAAIVAFGTPLFRTADSGPASTSATSRSVAPPETTSASTSATSEPEAPPPTLAGTSGTGGTVIVTTSTTAPGGVIPKTPNCQHAQGDGSVVSAAYLQTTTSPPEKVGAIQLCRDSTHYWAYLVRYTPLPSGQWANAYLHRSVDGQFDAKFSCAATAQGGKGIITGGGTECWTPKITGTATNLTFQALASQCDGSYGDTTNCTAAGDTARKR